MAYRAGHEEDLFLKSLNVTFQDIEPLAKDCTEVLVWHTQTIKEKAPKVQEAIHINVAVPFYLSCFSLS